MWVFGISRVKREYMARVVYAEHGKSGEREIGVFFVSTGAVTRARVGGAPPAGNPSKPQAGPSKALLKESTDVCASQSHRARTLAKRIRRVVLFITYFIYRSKQRLSIQVLRAYLLFRLLLAPSTTHKPHHSKHPPKSPTEPPPSALGDRECPFAELSNCRRSTGTVWRCNRERERDTKLRKWDRGSRFETRGESILVKSCLQISE